MSNPERTYGTQKKTLEELRKIGSTLKSIQRKRDPMLFYSQRTLSVVRPKRGAQVHFAVQEDHDGVLFGADFDELQENQKPVRLHCELLQVFQKAFGFCLLVHLGSAVHHLLVQTVQNHEHRKNRSAHFSPSTLRNGRKRKKIKGLVHLLPGRIPPGIRVLPQVSI